MSTQYDTYFRSFTDYVANYLCINIYKGKLESYNEEKQSKKMKNKEKKLIE